jgi:propionate CoA-transferase
MKNKVVTAEQAVALIRDRDIVGFSGFGGVGTPEALIVALEERFNSTGSPRDLTLIFPAGLGNGRNRGLNRLAHEGLLRRVIGGHWGLLPKLAEMAVENRIEAYNLPQGVISHLCREIAAGHPGVFTKVGIGTFVDPRQGGGKVNTRTTEDLVRVHELDGEEWLFYRAFPINVALLRATTADPSGNVTMEREALTLDNLAVATAAQNSGGLVIVQVERLAERGSLSPKQVVIPGVLVDCVVVAESKRHMQTYGTAYDPALSGEMRVPLGSQPPLPLDERKIIARRCAFELPLGGVVNLGIGVPEGVGAVANEEGLTPHITLTAEPGIIGGVPLGGANFGAALNSDAIIAQNQQFDFYDGGGLDLACLGMAQADRRGNVNVSRFGPKLAGSGGFINISQNAKELVFAGTFTAGGLEISVADNRLRILTEGKVPKFVDTVEQITFNGDVAVRTGKTVLYVTERCVFRLTPEGLELIEVAPGVDIDRDILAHMAFRPLVRSPREMERRIFGPDPMGLEDTLLQMDFGERLSYDDKRNMVFLNLVGHQVLTRDDVERMRHVLTEYYERLRPGFSVIVDYDDFRLDDRVADRYFGMIEGLSKRFGHTVTRYTTSAFLRAKLGDALARRNLAPHIFETRAEAHAFAAAHRPAPPPGR